MKHITEDVVKHKGEQYQFVEGGLCDFCDLTKFGQCKHIRCCCNYCVEPRTDGKTGNFKKVEKK